MLDYPKCTTCSGKTFVAYRDKCNVWHDECPTCQGYGDLRVNALPDLTDSDYDELDKSQRWAMQEVFGVN